MCFWLPEEVKEVLLAAYRTEGIKEKLYQIDQTLASINLRLKSIEEKVDAINAKLERLLKEAEKRPS